MNAISLNQCAFDGAIIDLDGTMVDTMGDFVAAINLMLLDMGLSPVERSVVELRVGKGSEYLVKSVLNTLAAQSIRPQKAINTEAYFESALGLYQMHYSVINGQYAQVYPGVLEGLQAMQQAGLKLACLTNKPLAFAQELLRLKGLDSYFSVVFGGDSFSRKKPDPLPLLKTCEALGTAPDRTLMIGDSSNDAQAARAARCTVVLVTYGYNHGKSVRGVDADGYVDSLAGICRLK